MSNINQMKSEMNGRINAYVKGVTSNREALRTLSRDLLTYVPKTNDADSVKRLLENSSPVMTKKLSQFFNEFIGWEFDLSAERYGKKHPKQKTVASKLKKATEALADPDFNFETWYAAKEAAKGNGKKAKDHNQAVDRAIKAGLSPKEGETGLSKEGLVKILMANNFSLRELMEVAKEML